MLADLIPYLACPHCASGFTSTGGSLRCDSGHVFDVARQGYVSLLPGNAQTGSADTAEMVRAREEVLAGGHLEAVAQALSQRAASMVAADDPGLVVDIGAGPGYYLRAVLERLPHAVGAALDLSKHAARRAARADARIGAVVCDAWQTLPLRTGVAALALCVFAPRTAAELWRVLRPGAALLVVTPTPRHLGELIEPLGLLAVDQDKPRRLAAQLAGHFIHEDSEQVNDVLRLSTADAQRLVLMGPSAWHTDATAMAARLAALDEPVEATVSVTLGTYRRRETADLAASAP